MKKFKKVLVVGLACLTLSGMAMPLFANTQPTEVVLMQEKEMVILEGNHLWDEGEKMTRDVAHDVIHKDADGDAKGSFSISEPRVRIYIDNRDCKSDVEFTLKKTSSSHGTQTWSTVKVKAGKEVTVYDMMSGAGNYSYYISTVDGAPLYTGVKVREMPN